MKIENCFVCGKQPKVYQFSGGYCVQCKPLLKRTHWKVEAPTEDDAVKYWNERTVQFKDNAYKNIQQNIVRGLRCTKVLFCRSEI